MAISNGPRHGAARMEFEMKVRLSRIRLRHVALLAVVTGVVAVTRVCARPGPTGSPRPDH